MGVDEEPTLVQVIQALTSTDGIRGHTIDTFVEDAIDKAGVWELRNLGADGLDAHRIVEAGPDRVRLIGRMWSLGTPSHPTFWVDIEPDPERAGHYSWTIYFDVVAGSPRHERNALELLERPEDAAWRVILSGRASTSQEGLTIEEAIIAANVPQNEPRDVLDLMEAVTSELKSRRARRRDRR